jgi:predicted unusual protein kinase regulating ubiquinone biosynthesis (AarF/ABC1/UbiB family)
MSEQKKISKIKSSVFGRGLQLARLTMSTGVRLTSYGASSLLSTPEEKDEKWKSFLRERAGQVSRDLGELKGSLMKAGQMLSMYGEHFLPPEANELLKSLQSQSPPLDWPQIKNTLETEFTAEQLARLEIDENSIGSASLGQAHRAKIKATGEEIVLKIQYPGVDKAIDSDLKALRSFMSTLRILPKNIRTDHIFDEVRAMLTQEMDYEQEINETEKYRARLSGDERYIVPKIYREFCSKKVIATSFERGLSPDDPLVTALSPQRRNRLALNFLDLYLRELFDWGIIQTDPHLGNYKIRIDKNGNDQLVLLDFGAIRTYEEHFLVTYRKMVRSALFNDLEGLHQASLQLGFTKSGDDPGLLKIYEDFCLTTVEPFIAFGDPRNTKGQINAAGEYDWKNTDLPQRLTRLVFQMIQKFEVRPPPREILFIDRKTGGVFIFCSVMKAQINSRNIMLQYCKPNSI